jgi:hypothetical protein
VTALSTDLVAVVPLTLDTRLVLAPVGGLTTTLTTTLDRAAPLVPQLLAPVAAVPRTLLGPSGLVDATGALLVGTVTGLTDTATALTGTVAALGRSALGPPLETGTGIGTRALSPTLAVGPATDGNRLAQAARPAVVNGQGAAPGPGANGPVLAASGSPGTPRTTADAAVGSASRPGLPGGPAPWEPSAPAAPVGAAGASSTGGASGVAGVLPDPLAVTAILAGLVLVACARRGTWWFPEVVIGPD